MMIKRKNTRTCPFRKEYARSGNRGLKKYGMGNRLLGVTAVFLLKSCIWGIMQKRLKSGRWENEGRDWKWYELG